MGRTAGAYEPPGKSRHTAGRLRAQRARLAPVERDLLGAKIAPVLAIRKQQGNALQFSQVEFSHAADNSYNARQGHLSTIQGILARTGGIRPPSRRRSRRSLSLAEREEISRGVFAGQ